MSRKRGHIAPFWAAMLLTLALSRTAIAEESSPPGPSSSSGAAATPTTQPPVAQAPPPVVTPPPTVIVIYVPGPTLSVNVSVPISNANSNSSVSSRAGPIPTWTAINPVYGSHWRYRPGRYPEWTLEPNWLRP